MKIGVNLLLWTSRVTLVHVPVLRMRKRTGYDGVEVPVLVGSVTEFAEVGRMVAGCDHWISVEAFGQALPDIAAATRIWRPLFADETEVVTEAIALIRLAWAA